MKNRIIALLLLSILALSSCTKIIYTHDQVLGSYKTREEVLKQFGSPDQKKINADGEEWLYTYEADRPLEGRNVKPFNTTTTEVTEFGQYEKYVIFNLDKQGVITFYRTEGLDFAKRKPNIAGTIVLGSIGVVVVAGVVLALVINSWHLDQLANWGGKQ